MTPETRRALRAIQTGADIGAPLTCATLAHAMNGSQYTARHYLDELYGAGLIRSSYIGGRAYYAATAKGLEALGHGVQYLTPAYCPDCDGDVVPAGSPPICPGCSRPLSAAA